MFLIEINVPGEGWQAFKIAQHMTLDVVLTTLRNLYPDDDIHDIRVKRLTSRMSKIRAMRAVNRYWKRPKQRHLWENRDA